MKTKDQMRAADAWRVISSIKPRGENDREEFKTQVRKMPTRILASGLGPALGFLKAKDICKPLQDAVSQWITHRPADDDRGLLQSIMNEDFQFMRYATEEALAYLKWLSRFAEAELKSTVPVAGEQS